MSFLATLSATILQWVIAGGVKLISAWMTRKEAQHKINKTADTLEQNLETSKTDQDRNKAVIDLVNNSFS